MSKRAKELSDHDVRQLHDPGLYAVGGVPGLYLQVRGPTSRSWILRKVWNASRRDLGLGSYPVQSLDSARDKAIKWAWLIDQGIDPREEERAAPRHRAAKATIRK